jgi:hypothetical protein
VADARHAGGRSTSPTIGAPVREAIARLVFGLADTMNLWRDGAIVVLGLVIIGLALYVHEAWS